MTDEIKKLKFKQNIDFQVEVIPLHILTKLNNDKLAIPHRTNFYHIFLFENCQPVHFVDFEPIKVRPYSLLFINKDRVHQFDLELIYEGNLLIFTDDFFCTSETDISFLRSSILFSNLADDTSIKLNQNGLQKYIAICQSINEELSLPSDNLKHQILKNLLHNFLLLAERAKREQGFTELRKGTNLDYTLLFRDALELNYTKQKSVSYYAQFICISEKRLRQATMEVLGKSPKEIISERVLLEAKRLLVHSNLTIKDIGQDLGFEDPAYFVRYFHKNNGTTPSEFREIYLQK